MNEGLKDELAVRDEPANLTELVTLAARLDNRLWEGCWERAAHLANPPTNPKFRSSMQPVSGAAAQTDLANPSTPRLVEDEPMQQGRAKIHGVTSPQDLCR